MTRFEPFNRLNDAYFKYVFSTEGNKALTIAFLNAALRDLQEEGEIPPIVDILFMDRESSPLWEDAKLPRFDVIARASDGRIFHIEVQVARDPFFLRRSFFYTISDSFTQMKRGMNYGELSPVLFIGLVAFNLFGPLTRPRPWHTLHRILNVRTGEWQFRDVEFHIVEFPALERWSRRPETEFQEILYYLDNIGGEELMQELAARNPTIERMCQVESLFKSDPLLIRDYLVQERARLDYLASLESEREQGISLGREQGISLGREQGISLGREQGISLGREQGISLGREQGISLGREQGISLGREQGISLGEHNRAIASARRMLKAKMPPEQISEFTDLPLDEILALRERQGD